MKLGNREGLSTAVSSGSLGTDDMDGISVGGIVIAVGLDDVADGGALGLAALAWMQSTSVRLGHLKTEEVDGTSGILIREEVGGIPIPVGRTAAPEGPLVPPKIISCASSIS